VIPKDPLFSKLRSPQQKLSGQDFPFEDFPPGGSTAKPLSSRRAMLHFFCFFLYVFPPNASTFFLVRLGGSMLPPPLPLLPILFNPLRIFHGCAQVPGFFTASHVSEVYSTRSTAHLFSWYCYRHLLTVIPLSFVPPESEIPISPCFVRCYESPPSPSPRDSFFLWT